MLCQLCGKNPATTHIKTIVDGELTECSLCSACANEMGYGNLFTSQGVGVLGPLFGGLSEPGEEERCPVCGASFGEIARSGRVGCAQCYHIFYNRLMPTIQRIHGNTKHCGKTPDGSLPQVRPQNQLAVLRQDLRRAIDDENFEHAALLRDQIKALEGQGEKQ